MVMFMVGVWLEWPDSNVHIVMCDVGQGDATVVIHRFTQVVIDGGPSSEKMMACLSERMPFWDRQIEMVVVSNNDEDHYLGLIEVLERYEVGMFVASSIVKKAKSFEKLREVVVSEEALVHVPQVGEELKAGELAFKVLWPQEKMGDERLWHAQPVVDASLSEILGAMSVKEPNSYSVVLELDFGEFEALFTGDIGEDEEKILLERGLRDIEYLKVGHHGSKYSSSLKFLEKIMPEVAVIGVGAKNSYGHPTKEVLGNLEQVGAKVLRTDKDGIIEVVSDGERMWINTD